MLSAREYPVRGAGSDPVLQAWGSFNASALRLVEANGWSR